MAIIWGSMSDIQRQFVVARLLAKSDAEACRKINISISCAANWPSKELIHKFIDYQRRDVLNAARLVLAESTLDAVEVLRNKLVGRQALTAAKEILDRAGLPAITRQEISGPSGAAIEVKAVDYRNGITALKPNDDQE